MLTDLYEEMLPVTAAAMDKVNHSCKTIHMGA